MKTTLILPDPLVARIKAEAAARDTSMSEVVVDAVQRMLDTPAAAPSGFRLPAFDLGVPAVNIANREALYDFLDRER
jgi:hypothetical protein